MEAINEGGKPTSLEYGWDENVKNQNVEIFVPDPKHEIPLSAPSYPGDVTPHSPATHPKHKKPWHLWPLESAAHPMVNAVANYWRGIGIY